MYTTTDLIAFEAYKQAIAQRKERAHIQALHTAEHKRDFMLRLQWEYRMQLIEQMEVMQELNLTQTHRDTYNVLHSLCCDTFAYCMFLESMPASYIALD